ncbi:MAG: cyclase [Sulfobacillus acidophilus]|uniref:Cyclase n=1 Tax=Sulfobacillus acidophilus TaxID=53633 RepID=A0A2T2WHK9_9FIRM|nr:MAG: cyclase [Sulfobacillus acidophilus]
MPIVEVKHLVKAPIDAVYQLVADQESYPQFMKAMESIRVLERGDGYTLTEWIARLQGARFRWIERDLYYPAQHRITYDQTEGDLKVFRGYWELTEVPEGTQVVLVTEFEFGIPMLAAMLNPVAKMALRNNSKDMLEAIGAKFGADHGGGPSRYE